LYYTIDGTVPSTASSSLDISSGSATLTITNDGIYPIAYILEDMVGNTTTILSGGILKIDQTLPTTAITLPSTDTTVGYYKTIEFTSDDNVEVVDIKLYYNNTNDTTTPILLTGLTSSGDYSYDWDTTYIDEGIRYLLTIAIDQA